MSWVISKIISFFDSQKGWVEYKIAKVIKEDCTHCRDDQMDKLSKAGTAKDIIVEGYWQNINYILPYQHQLAKQLTMKIEPTQEFKQYKELIEQTISIGVHVRRGDFVNLGWEQNEQYYKNAMKYMGDSYRKCCFFIFSDDPVWVEERLLLESSCFLVNLEGEHKDLYEFELLKACRHQIISESTFGWWAAY